MQFQISFFRRPLSSIQALKVLVGSKTNSSGGLYGGMWLIYCTSVYPHHIKIQPYLERLDLDHNWRIFLKLTIYIFTKKVELKKIQEMLFCLVIDKGFKDWVAPKENNFLSPTDSISKKETPVIL